MNIKGHRNTVLPAVWYGWEIMSLTACCKSAAEWRITA